MVPSSRLIGARLTLVGASWSERFSHDGNCARRNCWNEFIGDNLFDSFFYNVVSPCFCCTGGVIVLRVRRINVGLCADAVAPVAVAAGVVSKPLLVEVIYPASDQAEIFDAEPGTRWSNR